MVNNFFAKVPNRRSLIPLLLFALTFIFMSYLYSINLNPHRIPRQRDIDVTVNDIEYDFVPFKNSFEQSYEKMLETNTENEENPLSDQEFTTFNTNFEGEKSSSLEELTEEKIDSLDSLQSSSEYQQLNDVEPIEQNFDTPDLYHEYEQTNYENSHTKRWMPMMKRESACCHIYSAYYDTRKSFIDLLNHKTHILGVIRVIGIIDRNMKETFQCHLKYLDDMIISLDAIAGEINEAHEGRKSGGFILCPIIGNPDDHVALPISVGVSVNKFESNDNDLVNFIEISYESFYEDKKERNIAVCPGPVFSSYDNALRIAEFVEIYKILGATKFYIYNASISEDVNNLLKFYESQGTIEIFKWNLEDFMKLNEQNIHYNGIMSSLNDCFYHATMVDDFKYFIHADFDEIIFSYESKTLLEFLKKNDEPKFHSFNFNNFFFFSKFGFDFSNVPKSAVNTFLYTQVQITRTHDALKHHDSSKYIAKANSVFEIGNHFVWSADKATNEYFVTNSSGALHHYREECKFNYCELPTENDYFARNFAEMLWKNVDEVCGKVFNDGICPMGEKTQIPEMLAK